MCVLWNFQKWNRASCFCCDTWCFLYFMLLLLTHFRLPLKQWMARNGDLHMAHKKCMKKIQRGKHIDKIFYSLFIFFFSYETTEASKCTTKLILIWLIFESASVLLPQLLCVATSVLLHFTGSNINSRYCQIELLIVVIIQKTIIKDILYIFFFAYWFRYENLYSWTKHGLLYFFSCLVL